MNEEEGVPPRDDMPVQGIFDPETGRNITGEVASQSRRDSDKSLEQIGKRAIQNLVSGREIGHVMDIAREEIHDVLDRHYTGLKLPVDENRLADLSGKLGAILVAYSSFLEELDNLVSGIEKTGFSIKKTIQPRLSFHFAWDSSLEPFFLEILAPDESLYAILLAIPHCHMYTRAYGPNFFGGEPPAAEIIWSGKHGHIFICQESTPPPEFYELIFLDKIEHPDIVPMMVVHQYGTLAEVSFTDPACVDVAAEPSEEEVMEIVLKEIPEIQSIGFMTSGYPEKTLQPRNIIEPFP